MFRSSLFLAGTVLFAAGCVPVTEPVGPIDKAEPDKNLAGTWTVVDASGSAKSADPQEVVVDVPEVKGNPKGLMRALTKRGGDEVWFFVTTAGKHTYASLILAPNDVGGPLKFSKEGAFEEWQKAENKWYFVFRYARNGDKLTVDCGNHSAFTDLMKDEKIEANRGDKPLEFYKTPAGWLAKYLDKTGPAKLFDKTNYLDLKREKK
jgi:hypothetical protein